MTQNNNFTENLANTGTFLELACLKFINEFPGFTDRETQTPYTINWGPIDYNGVIDFVCLFRSEHVLICYVLESKRANPGIKNWIFFERNEVEDSSNIFFRMEKLTPKFYAPMPIFGNTYDRAFQVMDSSNTQSFKEDPIYDASLQINKGLKFIINDEHRFTEALRYQKVNKIFYVPIVITTANLYTCNVKAEDVDIKDGKILNEKVSYEPKEWVEYSFPRPEFLKISKTDRHSTFIVNSQFLNKFFYDFSRKMIFADKDINQNTSY